MRFITKAQIKNHATISRKSCVHDLQTINNRFADTYIILNNSTTQRSNKGMHTNDSKTEQQNIINRAKRDNKSFKYPL